MRMKKQRASGVLKASSWLLTGALACVSTGSAMAAGSQWFNEADPLQAAHGAYLDGRDQEMVTNLRTVLEQPDLTDAERKNALELMTQAYRTRGGNLPADWELPGDMPHFKVAVSRTESPGDRVRYKLKLSGELAYEGALTDLKLTKFPDEVVLHRQGDLGEWEDEQWQGKHEFKGQTKKSKRPPSDGLYLVEFTMADGEAVDGWFVLNDATSSASPVVTAPLPSSTVDGPHPELRYESFRSPEYKGFETVSIAAYLTQIKPDMENWDFVWGYWGDDHESGKVVLGKNSPYMDDYELIESLYYVTFNVREQYKFGGMRIARESRRSHTFSVDR